MHSEKRAISSLKKISLVMMLLIKLINNWQYLTTILGLINYKVMFNNE